MSYARFGAMIVTATIIMFGLMYLNTYALDHVWFSQTRSWMVGRETPTGIIPKSLRPIFRDRDDFTAGHTLTEQTLTALDASHSLAKAHSS